ncbi:MAG: hypothetical protein ACOC44_12725 [Promethearchaeia archaeon]
MNLKLKEETKFLFGKIKYSSKPVFDLDKIEESLNVARQYIEEKLNLLVTPPFIKPPEKGTVLGHFKETIRFNNANFNNELPDSIKHLIDDISFGFGEKGYYYDVYLNQKTENIETFVKDLQNFMLLIYELEKNLENQLMDFYYLKKDLVSRETKMFEISNFHTVVKDDGFLEKNLKLLNSMIQIINEESDIIVEEGKNLALPEIRLNLYNDYIFESLDLFLFLQ